MFGSRENLRKSKGKAIEKVTSPPCSFDSQENLRKTKRKAIKKK